MTYEWIDLDDDYDGGVLQADWPARLDLLFVNAPQRGPTWIWISPMTGAYWKVPVVEEA